MNWTVEKYVVSVKSKANGKAPSAKEKKWGQSGIMLALKERLMRIDWHQHISVDPEVHHGEPCITGTRVPVSIIIGSVADGMSFDEIIDSYPQLKKEAVQAALAYAADIVRQEVFLPFAG